MEEKNQKNKSLNEKETIQKKSSIT
jgi:hypothetical protein